MKLGDIVETTSGPGRITGIVPSETDPIQHPEKVQKSDDYDSCDKSQIGGAPRDHESYIVAITGRPTKTQGNRPDILVWPKNRNIVVANPIKDIPKPKATVKSNRRKVNYG
jgi:hypothetical protein